MSAYAPSLPHTADLRGTDRVLVQVGTFLADVGRRHAAARAARLAEAARQAAADRARVARQASVIEHLRDNAAQVHPLGLC